MESILRIAAVVTVASVLIATGHVMGCECYGPTNARSARDSAEAVFVGRVVELDDDLTNVTFEVLMAWKGAKVSTFQAENDQLSCPYPFEEGRLYLVYALSRSGQVIVNNCHRTYPLDPGLGYPLQALEDITQLGRPKYQNREPTTH